MTSSDEPLEQTLARIRAGEREAIGNLLQLYRGYLAALARARFDQRLRARMNPSDLVQEAMFAAHRDFDKFRGHVEGELLSWLRGIFCGCLSRAVEAHVMTDKRDVRREVAMANQGSSNASKLAGLAGLVADRGPSPSEEARRQEQTSELKRQLAKLKPAYRQVIIDRNLNGLSFDEIAERMSRTPGATRMLWLRAIEHFRRVCDDLD